MEGWGLSPQESSFIQGGTSPRGKIEVSRAEEPTVWTSQHPLETGEAEVPFSDVNQEEQRLGVALSMSCHWRMLAILGWMGRCVSLPSFQKNLERILLLPDGGNIWVYIVSPSIRSSIEERKITAITSWLILNLQTTDKVKCLSLFHCSDLWWE